ncbi:glycan-binding surface protein [Bacteroides sp.]|uniref:glycan-binding surface protein n=1 Tax=Bacteroides sp. TaxID=29523 RepID=UPI0025C09D9F|nr:glycan-binding surface protein [Bacteroides sp.]
MKTFKSIQIGTIACLIMTLITGFFSCSDDKEIVEQVLPPTIVKVSIWNEDSEDWTIPEAGENIRIGTPLRIEGTNMSKTIAVYINGGQVAAFQAEENVIELVIPDIPLDEEVKEVNLNLIRVVNKAGAATCTAEDFQFFGKQISFTGLSLSENGGRTWTAIQEAPIGGKVRIEGDGLKTVRSLSMNGVAIGLEKATISDNALIVDIPEDLPFGVAVGNEENRNKMELVTAYDNKTFDCRVAGKQVEISKITDANGTVITEAGRNTVVVIEGKYFTTLQKLSFNGQEIVPATVESNRITFTVPVDTEHFIIGEGELTVVNAFDENGISREIKFLGFVPSVTDISYTMPKPGNVIRLTGVNLYRSAKVFFPSSTGDKEGVIQDVSADATSMDVLVPEGVGDKAGYIRMESEGSDVLMKGIVIFYEQGVFLREFTDAELKLGNPSGSPVAFNKSALYNPDNRPDNDTNPVNPDYFIRFANSSIPANNSSTAHGAYLRFSTRSQFEKLLEKTDFEITRETLIKDIAMQVDVYMPVSWKTGMLAWRVNKDGGGLNGSRNINVAPWRVNEPFEFNGEWHTFTYKFTDFILDAASESETMTLGAWLSKYAVTYTTLFTFANGNFMYKSGQTADPQWNCVNITDFEMNLANMRLVPLAPIEFE